MTARNPHVPCVLSQYTVWDVIDKLATVKRSMCRASGDGILRFGSIVENRWAAEQYAVVYCWTRDNIT